jgi:FkbM family methyltransferase
LREARRRVNAWFGRDVLREAEVEIEKKRFGSNYGGYWIATEGLGPQSIVYSIGVGDDISFDLALIERFGCRVYAYDPTPRSIQWLKTQNLPSGFHFSPFGIAAIDGVAEFLPPKNPDFISHSLLGAKDTELDTISLEVKTLPAVMELNNHSKIDLLKMDIEGGEYEVIDHLLEAGLEIRQMCLEFHHRFPGCSVQDTLQSIGNLRERGYRLFHQEGETFSFIKL